MLPDSVELEIPSFFKLELEPEARFGKVEVLIEHAPGRDGTSVRVEPKNPASARMEAFCERGNDIVYLTVGAHTHMEVPLEGCRYSRLAGLAELASIIGAVKRGEMSETLWSKHGRIVRSEASIRIADRRLKIESLSPFSLPFGRSKEVREYQPY
jgi:hypothetical protein